MTMCLSKLIPIVLVLVLVRGIGVDDVLDDFKIEISTKYFKGAAECLDFESPFSLECNLVHPNIFKYVPVNPLVQWFYRKTTEDNFVNLFDDPQERYPDVESEQACSRSHYNTTNFYTCKYVQEKSCSPKYDGQYMCKIHVDLYDSRRTVYNASMFLVGDFKSDEGDSNCFIPTVTALRAQLSGNSSILLDWDATTLPPGSTYCDRSRRFSVRMFIYNDFYGYRLNQTSFTSKFINTTKRRETNFTLPLTAQYSVDKFYIFQIRNQYIRGRIEDGTVLESTKIYSSEVFYFGKQEPLDLIKPSEKNEKIVVLWGTLVKLECVAVGFPLPTTTMWFENNLIEPTRSSRRRLPSVSRTTVATADVAGHYQCNTVGYYLSPDGGDVLYSSVKHFYLEVYEEDSSTELCTAPGETMCSNFLAGHSVLLNTTKQSSNFPASIDKIISDLERLEVNSSEAEARCLNAAQAVVCHSSYPFCYNHNISRKVCKATCDLFRSGGPCASVIDPQRFPEAHAVIFSNCDNRTDSAGEYPECIHVPFDNNEENPEPSWCSVGRGTSYAGNVHFTESGILCQNWITQTPHYSGDDLHFAVNQCRNPQGRGTRPWCYTTKPGVRWEYCDVPQCEICTRYTETFCKDLLGYNESAPVYVNQHESEWNMRGLDGAELWMNREWHRLKIMEFNLSSNCILGIKELICHKTVPLCSSSSQATTPSSMKLCSDHCKASKLLQVCPGDLVSKVEKDMQSNRVTFSKLECDVDTNASNNTCLTSQAFLLATANLAAEDDTCYEAGDHGQTYNGTISVTRSGKACQSWGSLLPGAENYCRNPGQVVSSPWCYTDDTKWEYCDVPVCKKNIITEPFITTQVSGISSFAIAMVVFFVLLGVAIIVVGICTAWIMVYIRNKKMRKNSIRKMTGVGNRWDYVRNEMYHQVDDHCPTKMSKLTKAIENFPQFEKSAIHYVRQIGQGNFGVVFFAKAEGVPDEKVTEVAVKTLKEESCTEALEDFVREAKLMFSFDHENIVKIFGVAMESVPYYLIFEYMDKGDLAHFLRLNAGSAQRRLMAPFDGRPRSRTESTLSNDPPSLSSEQLADICKQIACGMKYLAKENHIHRDLACRNCLVKTCDREQTESDLVIKIGDFGMSHNLYSADYYRVKGSAILPVRWMSPEAIIYGKFSTESDVWSFGVVMWEVFSFAMQPYYGTSNEEVTEAIRRHKVLKQPTYCSNSMYEIMKQCWNQQPRLRPSFAELYNQLDEFRGSVSSGGSPSIDYFNSNSSDLDSDAFLEENSVDELDAAL